MRQNNFLQNNSINFRQTNFERDSGRQNNFRQENFGCNDVRKNSFKQRVVVAHG